MTWDEVFLLVVIAGIFIFFGLAIYNLGKLHGLREAKKLWEKHFGTEHKW